MRQIDHRIASLEQAQCENQSKLVEAIRSTHDRSIGNYGRMCPDVVGGHNRSLEAHGRRFKMTFEEHVENSVTMQCQMSATTASGSHEKYAGIDVGGMHVGAVSPMARKRVTTRHGDMSKAADVDDAKQPQTTRIITAKK